MKTINLKNKLEATLMAIAIISASMLMTSCFDEDSDDDDTTNGDGKSLDDDTTTTTTPAPSFKEKIISEMKAATGFTGSTTFADDTELGTGLGSDFNFQTQDTSTLKEEELVKCYLQFLVVDKFKALKAADSTTEKYMKLLIEDVIKDNIIKVSEIAKACNNGNLPTTISDLEKFINSLGKNFTEATNKELIKYFSGKLGKITNLKDFQLSAKDFAAVLNNTNEDNTILMTHCKTLKEAKQDKNILIDWANTADTLPDTKIGTGSIFKKSEADNADYIGNKIEAEFIDHFKFFLNEYLMTKDKKISGSLDNAGVKITISEEVANIFKYCLEDNIRNNEIKIETITELKKLVTDMLKASDNILNNKLKPITVSEFFQYCKKLKKDGLTTYKNKTLKLLFEETANGKRFFDVSNHEITANKDQNHFTTVIKPLLEDSPFKYVYFITQSYGKKNNDSTIKSNTTVDTADYINLHKAIIDLHKAASKDSPKSKLNLSIALINIYELYKTGDAKEAPSLTTAAAPYTTLPATSKFISEMVTAAGQKKQGVVVGGGGALSKGDYSLAYDTGLLIISAENNGSAHDNAKDSGFSDTA